MPVGKRFDFQLNGKGYMLVRNQGRAWHRTGLPDTPGKRSPEDAKYGVLPDEIDHPEVWDDWSGGAFHPYRRNGENTYHWAENFDARFPRQLVHAQTFDVPQGPQSPVGTLNLNFNYIIDGPSSNATEARRPGTGRLVSLGMKHFDAYEPTGSAFDFFGSYTNDVVSYIGRPALFGSYFYVGVLEATQFMRLDMAYAVINTDSHTMQAKNFATVGDRLWKASTLRDDVNGAVRYVQNTAADPTATANWSATYQVGNGADSIKDMIGFEDQLFLGMESGLYAGDASGTFVNVTAELQNQRHYDNCRDLAPYEDGIAILHVSGIYHYRAGGDYAQVEQIGPPSPGPGNPVTGYPRALRAIGPWLLAGYWTGSQSHLLAGSKQTGKWVWHTMNRLPGTPISKIHRLHVDGITVSSGGLRQMPNRLWALTDASLGMTGSAPRYLMPIPFQFGNPLAPVTTFSPNYVGSARIDLGNVDAGAPGTPKAYREFEVWADNLLSGYRYADIYYELNSSGSFALLGRANDSPKSTLFFPNTVNGQSIELSVRSFTASPAQTPVYRAFILRSATRPNSVDTITAQVRIADNIRDRMQGEMRNGATMLSELRDLAQQDAPVTLIDLVGAQHFVNVLPPIEEQEYYQKGEDYPEIMAQVKMAVMVYS